MKKQERHEMLEVVHTHTHTHTHGYLANRKGITLIALIITILVMLILAGVTISMVVGDNGVISKGENAKAAMEQSSIEDTITTSYYYDTENPGKLDFNDTEDAMMKNLEKAGYAAADIKIKGTPDANGVNDFPMTVEVKGKTGTEPYVYTIKQNGTVSKSNTPVSPGGDTGSGDTTPEDTELKAQVGPNAWATLKEDGTLIVTGTGDICTGDYEAKDLVDIRHLFTKNMELGNIEEKYPNLVDALVNKIGISGTVEEFCKIYLISAYDTYLGLMKNNGYTEAAEELEKLAEEMRVPKIDISDIIIPDGITGIGYAAFYSVAVKEITIPDSVSFLGKSCFLGSELEKIKFSENSELTVFGQTCFSRTKISEINIPKGVTKIDNKVFYNCNNITKVVIPDYITSIGDGAFYNCDSLTEVIIPSSVTTIGGGPFDACDKLTSIIVKNSKDAITFTGNKILFDDTSIVQYIPE